MKILEVLPTQYCIKLTRYSVLYRTYRQLDVFQQRHSEQSHSRIDVGSPGNCTTSELFHIDVYCCDTRWIWRLVVSVWAEDCIYGMQRNNPIYSRAKSNVKQIYCKILYM